jgi:hypothetical protein
MIRRALSCLAVMLALAAAAAGLQPAVAAAAPTDVLFVVDTTGSMDDALDDARDEMTDALTSISAQVPDVEFGVATVRDYGDLYGDSGDEPWSLAQPMSASRAAITDAFGDLDAEHGGDSPEAYGRALYESDVSPAVGWRPGARRLIVLVADDVPHDLDLNRGVPAADLTHSTPWDTGADPGRDEVVGTADDLVWLDVLGQLQRDAVPLLFVFYHGDEDYVPYWRYWAGLTGGEVSSVGDGGATGTLGGEVADIVKRNAPPCAPALAGPPQPASGHTAQAGAPATTVTLTAPAGTRFCFGTSVSFGGTDADVTIAPGGANLTAPIPRTAGQNMTVTLPAAATVSVPFAVDNYRSPYGFQFGNYDTYGKNGGGTVTTTDIAAVFGNDAVYVNLPALGCHYCVVSPAGLLLLHEAQEAAGGMCFGFTAASMRFLRGDRKLNEFGTATTVSAIADPDPANPSASAAWRFIRQQQISQISTQITDAMRNGGVGTAAAIRQRLAAAFAAGDRPLVELSFQEGRSMDGHSLVAYDVEDGTGGAFDIDVYDPNVESDLTGDFGDAVKRGQQFDMLKVHVHADGTWSYTGSFSHGRFGDPIAGGPYALQVLPRSVLPATGLKTPSSWLRGVLSFAAQGATLTQVSDAKNHTLLAPDGSLKPDAPTALPGVRELPLAIDPGSGTRLELGGSGPYRLTLEAGAGVPQIEQTVAGSGLMGSVTVANPAAGSHYDVSTSPRTVGVAPVSGTASSTITLLKHTSGGADRSIVAQVGRGSGQAKVSFDGPGETATLTTTKDVHATVTLSQAGGGALPSSATISVLAHKGERLELRPRAWSSLTRIVARRRTASGRTSSQRVIVRLPTAGAVHLGTVRATGHGARVKLRVPYRVTSKSGDVVLVSYVVRRSGRVVTRGSTTVHAKHGTLIKTLHVKHRQGGVVEVRLTRLTGGRAPASVQVRQVVRIRAA